MEKHPTAGHRSFCQTRSVATTVAMINFMVVMGGRLVDYDKLTSGGFLIGCAEKLRKFLCYVLTRSTNDLFYFFLVFSENICRKLPPMTA